MILSGHCHWALSMNVDRCAEQPYIIAEKRSLLRTSLNTHFSSVVALLSYLLLRYLSLCSTLQNIAFMGVRYFSTCEGSLWCNGFDVASAFTSAS